VGWKIIPFKRFAALLDKNKHDLKKTLEEVAKHFQNY
jgi:hypothetical protein